MALGAAVLDLQPHKRTPVRLKRVFRLRVDSFATRTVSCEEARHGGPGKVYLMLSAVAQSW